MFGGFKLPWSGGNTNTAPPKQQTPRNTNGNSEQAELINQFINYDIKIIDTINAGSFGEIYLGISNETQEQYAIKVIKKVHANKNTRYLIKEFTIMQKIAGKGLFPRAQYLNPLENYLEQDVLLMDRLGPNIHELLKLNEKNFPISTVAKLMVEMISRLEEFHNCGFLHRDIKPDNFCLGGKNLKDIYLIDFGLSLSYLDQAGEHVPMLTNKGFVGTPRYASKNSHNGVSQSRRDDLESLGFVLMYFNRGSLQW